VITTDQLDRLRRNMQPNNQKALRGNPHAPSFPRRFVGSGIFAGNRPRGTTHDTRIKYPSAANHNAAYDTDSVWPYIQPWFVIWPGKSHKSVNSHLEIAAIRYAFCYRETGWTAVTSITSQFASNHLPYISSVGVNDAVDHTYNNITSKNYFNFAAGLNPIFAQAPARIEIPTPTDLICLYIEVEGRVFRIDAGGVDDRAVSEFCLQSGGDYYPHASESMPGMLAVCSRFVNQHSGVSKITCATVSPPGAELHRNSTYKGRVSVTENEFILTDPTFIP
jgi:hypothetical protein